MVRAWMLVAMFGVAACQGRAALPHGHSDGADFRGVLFSQSLQFRDTGLEVCARLENQSEARWVLRAPLGFGGGRQFRVLMGPPLSAALPPQGHAPATDDLLSYDLLEPLETRQVCTIFARSELPKESFWLETLYQPWSRAGGRLPLELAFVPGSQLLDTPEGGALSGGCLVDPAAESVSCDVVRPG